MPGARLAQDAASRCIPAWSFLQHRMDPWLLLLPQLSTVAGYIVDSRRVFNGIQATEALFGRLSR